ncbi:hypothetical protein EOA32_21390 [Mesorhizobium sp. M1A.F.Ca.ET.072.01.1.1]|uniref:hypothetical protein n=1 Tax=Mesorhizobium sp. M1A.F.Ca.ET.072.01.1.1 TaxID=2496753 RepID=UPI000FD4204C|nr:hypothetical protein [Mesorhizobium sp. M1A.F.Ca.ET.072.01.1.1]RUW49788.1 hypothetical protein EOA32_21390 [Mesorhizobium sp. M1A.F.Ca.ET.072.01.1.1]TIV02916.1 MAG: hypothetical protein E5W04_10975 [Mesorhizobium sp.]
MHQAIRVGQVSEAMVHDPYSAANDNLAELQQTKTTPMPATAILGWLTSNDYINGDERDAGEHLIKMASITRSKLTSPVVRYSARTADGRWRQVEVQRHTVRPALDGCISAIRYEPRRKATVQAFVVDEANIDMDNPHRVAQGLADVARHLWGTKRTAATPIVVASDNEPEDDTPVAEPTIRVSDNFKRLHSTGSLDKDPETNDILHASGMRYAQDHHEASISPLAAIDYSRTKVDGGRADGISETLVRARDRYRASRELLTAYYADAVEMVVVDGLSLGEVGLKISAYKNKDLAGACAKERLIGGLRMLAKAYGLLRT